MTPFIKTPKDTATTTVDQPLSCVTTSTTFENDLFKCRVCTKTGEPLTIDVWGKRDGLLRFTGTSEDMQKALEVFAQVLKMYPVSP